MIELHAELKGGNVDSLGQRHLETNNSCTWGGTRPAERLKELFSNFGLVVKNDTDRAHVNPNSVPKARILACFSLTSPTLKLLKLKGAGTNSNLILKGWYALWSMPVTAAPVRRESESRPTD